MNITESLSGDVEIDYPTGRFIYKDGKFEPAGRVFIGAGRSITITKEGDKIKIE